MIVIGLEESVLFSWLNSYLRCGVTFKGTSEDFDVDSESIAKAEQCLQKVLERWEGISSRSEGKYLLAMSDLHLRKKQYLKALEFANEAMVLCSKRNQLSMVEWVERRISYLERQIGTNRVDVDRSEVSSAVADPGFPVGGRGPRRGGRGLPRRLRFENFACQNKRIWTRRGGRPP